MCFVLKRSGSALVISAREMQTAERGNRSATKRDELPEEFTSLREAGEFWDTHDSGEYEDAMTAIELEVEISEDRIYLSVARNIVQQLRRYAREQGVSTETLANLWLQEKLMQESTHSA